VSDRVTQWPLYWFARLEGAVERRDFAAAADAQRHLQRLGIDVQYRPLQAHRKRQIVGAGEVADASR
jgi:hypothetical protein